MVINTFYLSCLQYAYTYFSDIDVRVGEDAVTATTSYDEVKTKNKRCAFLNQAQPNLAYYTFTCPPPGIKGQYVTISSPNRISLYEIEVFG